MVVAACLVQCDAGTSQRGAPFRLQLRVVVDPAVDAQRLDMEPQVARLHLAGTPKRAGWTREALDDTFWRPVSGTHGPVDLLKVSEAPSAWHLSGLLPAGTYDHLLLEVDHLMATDAAGVPLPCTNIIEPIALHLDAVDGEPLDVALTLYVAADWPEEHACSVFAMSAQRLE